MTKSLFRKILAGLIFASLLINFGPVLFGIPELYRDTMNFLFVFILLVLAVVKIFSPSK